MSIASNAAMYWRFGWGLRGFLRSQITLDQARQTIKQRFRERQNNFLTLIRKAIYENNNSPYLKLLKLAGCEYGDIEKMTMSDGIESSLERLRKAGVYVSLEEFKGKKEVVRSGKAFQFREREFDNPNILSHFETRSGATRSVGTRTIYDFDSLSSYWATYMVPYLDAFGIFDIPYALWYAINPGFGPFLLLAFSKAGKPPSKWFSPLGKKSSMRLLRHKLLTQYIVYCGRLFRAKWPKPEYVNFDDAWKVANWMADAVRERGGCCLNTYTNSAVRVCHAAKERGFDINGAKFLVGGEPVTGAKRAEIEATGATACPYYGFTEGGFVGAACSNPNEADDIHLFEDSFALILHTRQVIHAGISVDAFLFTSLLPSTAKVLLNVEIGDYGVIETRSCGCKFDELGFNKHIYHIRSFDKLTGEGVSLVGTDLVRIIEEVLPTKFGGSSIDYQILEEEDERRQTRLSIIVSPSVGTIDEDELIKTILIELQKGGTSEKNAAEMWFQAEALRVRREEPRTTVRGKLLPLHIHH
jgi:hypothetical protein